VFDGEALTGWKELGGGKWSIEDGAILGESGDGRYGWLILEEPVADFVLELECRIEAAGNSGIQFRSHVIDDVMIGYQAELDPRPTHGTGGVYEEKGRGWLHKPDERGLAAMKPMGEWNHYRIEAIGEHIRLAVNGVETVSFRDRQARSGIIALQVHSGPKPVKVRWRNIRLQDLGDGGGWSPLTDGRTLAGWHTQGEPDCWRVEDGQIIGELTEPSPYAYLATDRKHGDIELKLQMLFESDQGNSGVFVRSSFPPHCASCDKVARNLPEDVADFKCPHCGHDQTLPMTRRVHIHGPQIEFAPPGQHTGAIYDSAIGKWANLEDMNERKEKMHRFKEWNELRVRVVGDDLTVYLNGYLISDLSGYPLPRDGVIALQLHAGGAMKVRFKDIHIREALRSEK
jgi:predicted RNA-binding Zn-ribbon protein involved in translation (DUF1610 family)